MNEFFCCICDGWKAIKAKTDSEDRLWICRPSFLGVKKQSECMHGCNMSDANIFHVKDGLNETKLQLRPLKSTHTDSEEVSLGVAPNFVRGWKGRYFWACLPVLIFFVAVCQLGLLPKTFRRSRLRETEFKLLSWSLPVNWVDWIISLKTHRKEAEYR